MVGWQYHHDRDLTGFEDGSENPSIVEATSVALVPPGSPGRVRPSCCSSNGSTMRSPGKPSRSHRRKRSSVAGSRTARSSTQDRRRPTSPAPIRIGSARSSGATSRTGPCRSTGRSSSGSAGARDRCSRCSRAWSARVRAARPADERRPSGHRRLLRHPVGGPLGGVRGGRPPVTALSRSRDILSAHAARPEHPRRVRCLHARPAAPSGRRAGDAGGRARRPPGTAPRVPGRAAAAGRDRRQRTVR